MMKLNKHLFQALYVYRYLSLLIFLPFVVNGQCDDPINNFTYIGTFENSAYYTSNAPAQPMQAQTLAISLGGNLVTINSAAENNFLQANISEMIYIGLSDDAAEGNLVWASGDALGYSNIDNCNFCNDNDAENDFAIMHPWNGGWSFTNRWSQRNFIVEISCDDGGGSVGEGTDCNETLSGYEYLGQYEDSKYFLSNNLARPADAQAAAAQENGYLVTVDNAAENAFLSSKINEMVYIGLSDVSNEGNLQWLGDGNSNYRNIDQNCGFCAENDQSNDYTVLHPWNGKWSFSNQWSQRKYIIEIPCGGEEISSLSYTICPADRTILLAAGQTSTLVNWTPPTLTNNCDAGVASNVLISGPNNNADLAAGTYTVRYRGTNNCGDIANCTFTITVESDAGEGSSTIAFLNCPSDRSIQLAPGETTAFVNWTPPSVSSTCAQGGLSLGLLSGPNNNSNLMAGNYTIRYRGANNCGDVAMCEFTISVNSSSSPSSININCPNDLAYTIPQGSNTIQISYPSPTVNSVCNQGGTSLTRLSGPTNNSNIEAGNYTVRYRAINNCGDVAICEFNVQVSSTSTPSSISINCPPDIFFPTSTGQTTRVINYQTPSFNSICASGGGEIERISGIASNTNVTVGIYTIVYRATNNCGDSANCTFKITVQGDPFPVNVVCPSNIIVSTNNQTGGVVNYTIPTVNSDCPTSYNASLIAGLSSGSVFPIGTTTVRYSFTRDQNAPVENCQTAPDCVFTVTVNFNDTSGGNGVNYTANDQVTPYTGVFRPGTNVGYNPPWTDEEMANLAAGNDQLGIKGIGARTMRPGLFEVITEVYGYDFRLETYQHYASLGLDDLTMIVGFPSEWHRDQTDYCGNGFNSSLFRNLYTDIWDDGANGTPYNDENFYAAYIYEVVSRYGPYVKFWEIWNEPGFDLTGNRGWRQPGDSAGNWWDDDPDPCEYILRAPIEHYVRTLRISWEIIKSLQPDDYVAVAGVGYVSFLDAILRNTDDPNTDGQVTAEYPLKGGAYFDVMGFHSYPDIDGSIYDYDFATDTRVFNRHSDRAAAGITSTKNDYQDILDNYGYDGGENPEKEWIITEINVPRKAFRPDAMSGGEEMQVNYIIKAVATAMKNDVHQMHVYNLGDKTTESEAVTEFDLYGMHKRLTGTDAYTQVRNQEAIAYKSVADFVFGSRYDTNKTTQMNLPNNLDGAALRLPNGRYKYIIWAKTTQDQSEFANGNYSFPSSFGYNQVFKREWNFTDTDQVLGISPSNINLTGRPIFITETPNNDQFETRLSDNKNLNLSINEILPNPASDEIRMVLEARESDNYQIKIFDARGQLMEQRSTFIKRGFSDERFDISEYVHGMYFVIIEGGNQRSTKIKFIKADPK